MTKDVFSPFAFMPIHKLQLGTGEIRISHQFELPPSPFAFRLSPFAFRLLS
jgi:hypothetical protein